MVSNRCKNAVATENNPPTSSNSNLKSRILFPIDMHSIVDINFSNRDRTITYRTYPQSSRLQVAKLNGTDVQRVHATYLIRCGPRFNGTIEPKEIVDLADLTTTKLEYIQHFLDIVKDTNENLIVLICWDGHFDECDWT